MKVFQHEDNGSWKRTMDRQHWDVGERWGDTGYVVVEISEDYRFNASVQIDRFEQHNSSVTVWLRVIEHEFDKKTLVFTQTVTDRLLPMRLREFEKALHKIALISGGFYGTFGVKKQGNAIGLEMIF